MSERKQIGVCLIATNKYTQFVQQLIDSIEKYFLIDYEITVFLFTDNVHNEYEYNGSIIKTAIPSYIFPFATLYRYKIFDENKLLFDQLDYLFYIDVDMTIVDYVGEEILGDGLTAVSHPGFFMNNGWGSSNCSKQSLAFVPMENRFHYCAGGFQGGITNEYLKVCNILNVRISDDEKIGIIAEWHDETHWNWYLNVIMMNNGFIRMRPDYCMVEDSERRKAWGINDLQPKIIALNKNHKEIRE